MLLLQRHRLHFFSYPSETDKPLTDEKDEVKLLDESADPRTLDERVVENLPELLGLQTSLVHEIAPRTNPESHFHCEICLYDHPYEDGMKLDCGHILCRECLSSYLRVFIEEQRVMDEELICPMPDCKCLIDVGQVRQAVDCKLWELFLDIRLSYYRPTDQWERCIHCKCENIFIVVESPETVTAACVVACHQCKEEACMSCYEQHSGMTCAEFVLGKEEELEDYRLLRNLMLEKGWINCPQCDVPVEKSFGCLFVSCTSRICRGKTYFCYVCGEELLEAEHFMHYPQGAYNLEGYCLNRPPVEKEQASWTDSLKQWFLSATN